MSKRSLYRPAAQSNVGHNKQRRRLAQGRLVSGTAQPVQSGVSRKLDTENPLTPRNGQNLTPRKSAPRETESRSPRPGRPQDSLDLTDSEVDFPLSKGSKREVLVLDASRQTVSPDRAEVDVVVGYEKSPAKVVCHSAAATQRHLSTSIDHHKVKVDNVPHLSLSEDTSHHVVISPRVVREKHVAGGRADPMSGTRQVFLEPTEVKDMSVSGQRSSHYPQPNFDDSQECDISIRNTDPRHAGVPELSDSDIQSVISESDACSIHEFLSTSKKGPMKAVHPAKTPGKKKGGKVIPSRYMQSSTKASEKSLQSLSTTKSFHKSMERPSSGKKRRPVSESRSRPATQSTPIASYPSEIKDKKTSTPTHEVTTLISQDIDASAIQAETSVISIADLSHIKQEKKLHKSLVKKTEEVTQDQLDTLYARYLQWLFVDAKAHMAYQSQEKEAMAQLSGLWETNEKLASREAELKMELARLKHQNILDDQLAVQESCLGPVMSTLSQVEKQYNSLADSLDTTRHQIRTSGIHIPHNEEQFLAKLESTLMESEQLLGELSVMTRQATPHIKSFSDALHTSKSTLNSQKHQMKGCREMLGACQSLVIHETSLKIQNIQINNAKPASAAT